MTKNINNSSLEAFPFGILQGKILLENDVLIDIDVLNVNLEMCKIVDLPREQIINCKLSNVDNIFLNQLFTKIKNDANRLLNNGIIEFYLTDIHSDLLYRISARLSSSDEISLILNPTYINDSKMDLQELELRYSRHEIIAGLNKTIYWEVNNEGLYTSVTNGVEKVLGYKPDELINKKYFYDLFPDNVREEYKVIGFGIINSKKILHGFENSILAKNGNIINVLSVGMPIFNENGESIGFCGSDIDITKQIKYLNDLENYSKELENAISDFQESQSKLEESLFERNMLVEELTDLKDKLEKSNAEKDKFFSIIAHDLRSPFSGFLGLTLDLYQNIEVLSKEDIIELSKMLKDSAQSTFKLLENLLEWSRIQRGTVNFNPDQLQLLLLVNNVISLQQSNFTAKNITIINNIDEGLYVFADVNMISTVLRNLISNALKFTPRNGKIELNYEQNNEVTILRIKDSGIGIPSFLLDKLFEIGAKTSRPGTEGESSSGLGLLLCREYIEKLGGTIWVESELGKGSTFYFTILRKNDLN